MRIRPCSDEDLDAVITLWRAVSAATYTFFANPIEHTETEDRAYFTDVIAQKNDLWLAEADGAVVGYLALQGETVDRLYVALDDQRRGIGTALLDHAKTLSPTGLRLFTHQGNTAACRFYESRGFRVVRYGVSPPPESEPDVEYRWQP